MFEVVEKKTNDLDVVQIKNIDTGEYVSIVPRFGTSINEIVLLNKNRLQSLLEGNKTLQDFEGVGVYNSAKLFPFVNRVEDGKYSFEGKSYRLPINFNEEQNAAHGFVCEKNFELISTEANEEFGEAVFKYNYQGDFNGYPFPFEIVLKYVLHKEEGFSCKTIVTSKEDKPIPMMDGWHPYFSFGDKVNDLHLKFSSQFLIETNNRKLPTGNKIPYNRFENFDRIGEDNFDNCFLLKPATDKHFIELYDKTKEIKMLLWMEAGKEKYNYFQVYIPPERTSIALEPMTGNVNAFNNGEGLIISEKFEASYGVKLL